RGDSDFIAEAGDQITLDDLPLIRAQVDGFDQPSWAGARSVISRVAATRKRGGAPWNRQASGGGTGDGDHDDARPGADGAGDRGRPAVPGRGAGARPRGGRGDRGRDGAVRVPTPRRTPDQLTPEQLAEADALGV